jgi:hypothetical protein
MIIQKYLRLLLIWTKRNIFMIAGITAGVVFLSNFGALNQGDL